MSKVSGNGETTLTPEYFLKLGAASWESKAFLTATELGVFTALSKKPMKCEELRETLGIHPRGARDFFDALVALKVLDRDNDDKYRNTPDGDIFLVKGKASYMGGILEMMSTRSYRIWDKLLLALQTGERQNQAVVAGNDVFAELYSNPERLEGFLSAMTGASAGPAMALANKFAWQNYETFVDIGCAQGCLGAQLALRHPHLKGTGFDLPVVRPVFEKYIQEADVANRVKFSTGDFFKDPLPTADVITMGHILHDWGLDTKKMLISKAYEALPDGGALIVYEQLIDDERRVNATGLLMSLNMLLETTDGFDFTGADCKGWLQDAGFKDIEVQHLLGPYSMVIAYK